MRRPPIAVVRGILSATSERLAGELENEDDGPDIEAAHAWALEQYMRCLACGRAARRARGDMHSMSQIMTFIYNDGGRAAAGYKGKTGDCVVQAIAIATGMPYQDVYDAINVASERERPRGGRKRSDARTGVQKPTIRRFLTDLGWTWTPTMAIGSGCKVHLRADELPAGRLIVAVSRHLVAVLDGVIHDTHDPSRDGSRCVYGYWTAP